MLGAQLIESIKPAVYSPLAGSINLFKSNGNHIHLFTGRRKLTTIELHIRACTFLLSLIYLVSISGMVGLAQSRFVTALVMFFVSITELKKVLKLSVREQVGVYLTSLSVTAMMVISVQGYLTYLKLDILMALTSHWEF